MPVSSYEPLPHTDPTFPVIFHLDRLSQAVQAHWHEGIELLYCLEGTAEVTADMDTRVMRPGELSIIPSGALHYIAPVSGAACRYYCLIVDPSLLEGTSLPGEKTSLQRQVNDPQVQALYLQLAQELEAREPYYRDAAKSLIRLLFTRLYRCWSTGEERQPAATGHQPEMVKQAILYLQAHYKEEVCVDDVCRHVGFSKYYFCHSFRRVTGRSVMAYVQDLRCAYARQLLQEGCTVSECAARCGFSDVSYFTRVFRRQTGRLPSRYREEHRETQKISAAPTEHD